jgi:proprotein convertase subtilisin/kexin type 5
VPQKINNLTLLCGQCPIENYMIQDASRSSCVCADQCYQTGPSSCSPCHYSCATCNGPSASSCQSCDIVPPVGTNRLLNGGQCICFSGYFDNPSTGTCEACHYSCNSCNGGSSTNCLSCNASMFRQMVNQQCQCNPGYLDPGSALCQCQTFQPNGLCSIPFQPTTLDCPPNSNNVNGVCRCNDQFINSSNFCTPCQPNAEKVSATECRCKVSFVNISGECATCPANTIPVNGTRC